MSDAYKKAGVDIAAGSEAVNRMKQHVRRTHRPEVLTDLGGFAGLFALDSSRYRQPVLVASTDGIGTKLKLAFALDIHHTIGIDLTAMCVNDIVVQGAEPLFFLDYIAADRVEPSRIASIVQGIADGCEEAGCALIGGETAEMPGFYHPGEYDAAGFCVGIAERDALVTGADIVPGDVILGLPSSGLHSNGFSLVRKLLQDNPSFPLDQPYGRDTKALGTELLRPTRIYVRTILDLLKQFSIRGMAHITGGGFTENIPRILPHNCRARINLGAWPIPPIFSLLQEQGDLTAADMFTTFNMGIGMVLIVDRAAGAAIMEYLCKSNEAVYLMGSIESGSPGIDWGGKL